MTAFRGISHLQEAEPHKAVRRDFVSAPKFQMTHSDSVLAGRDLDSCLLEDAREQPIQLLTACRLTYSLPLGEQGGRGETELTRGSKDEAFR